ncbi:MAG TPA: zf-HC2 domain-containing protein [Bryobacteraceae bacterium]|nr:zf-HC2 domain-containing protein [Bryobacteraceae bacterium]
MDHQTAVRLQASEKYLLGELPPAERDEFEEHLADCSRCMEDVSTFDIFAANARSVFEDRAAGLKLRQASSWVDWLRLKPLPALAFSGALNMAMAALVVYGAVAVLPRLHSLELPGASYSFNVRGLSRGAIPSVTVPPSSSYANARVDLLRQYQKYSYVLERLSGAHFRRSGVLAAAAGSDTLDIIVPVAGLEPGEYRLIVTGSDKDVSDEIGRCILTILPRK